MAKAKSAERINEMVSALREWQAIERHALSDTAEIIESTKSPLIRIIMEIIRHDSMMHHRVQQFLVDSLVGESVTVTREDVAEVWDKIAAHDDAEQAAIDLAKKLQAKAWDPIHKEILGYLVKDEAKHDTLLAVLNEVKKGMSRASGG